MMNEQIKHLAAQNISAYISPKFSIGMRVVM